MSKYKTVVSRVLLSLVSRPSSQERDKAWLLWMCSFCRIMPTRPYFFLMRTVRVKWLLSAASLTSLSPPSMYILSNTCTTLTFNRVNNILCPYIVKSQWFTKLKLGVLNNNPATACMCCTPCLYCRADIIHPVSLLVIPAYLLQATKSSLVAERKHPKLVFCSVVFSWVCMSTTCLGCYGLATMFLLSESAPWLGALHHGTGLTENQRLEYVVCQCGH